MNIFKKSVLLRELKRKENNKQKKLGCVNQLLHRLATQCDYFSRGSANVKKF